MTFLLFHQQAPTISLSAAAFRRHTSVFSFLSYTGQPPPPRFHPEQSKSFSLFWIITDLGSVSSSFFSSGFAKRHPSVVSYPGVIYAPFPFRASRETLPLFSFPAEKCFSPPHRHRPFSSAAAKDHSFFSYPAEGRSNRTRPFPFPFALPVYIVISSCNVFPVESPTRKTCQQLLFFFSNMEATGFRRCGPLFFSPRPLREKFSSFPHLQGLARDTLATSFPVHLV